MRGRGVGLAACITRLAASLGQVHPRTSGAPMRIDHYPTAQTRQWRFSPCQKSSGSEDVEPVLERSYF